MAVQIRSTWEAELGFALQFLHLVTPFFLLQLIQLWHFYAANTKFNFLATSKTMGEPSKFMSGLTVGGISDLPAEGQLFQDGVPPASQSWSLFDLPQRDSAKDINKQLLYRAALKSILFDDKPTKDDFSTLQKRALEDLTTIAGWLENQPDLTISEEILAVLDPKKVRDSSTKCLSRPRDASTPPGLPRASCAIKGKVMMSQDNRQYVSDGKKWVLLFGLDIDK